MAVLVEMRACRRRKIGVRERPGRDRYIARFPGRFPVDRAAAGRAKVKSEIETLFRGPPKDRLLAPGLYLAARVERRDAEGAAGAALAIQAMAQ